MMTNSMEDGVEMGGGDGFIDSGNGDGFIDSGDGDGFMGCSDGNEKRYPTRVHRLPNHLKDYVTSK